MIFKLPSKERLKQWKNFRSKLDSMPLLPAVQETQNFWGSCPFSPYYLEIDNPMTWPDPWNLIIENHYCDLAKALGIVYTLHLTNHKNRLFPELRLYFDPATNYNYHIVYLCQGKYVLNLIEDEVVNKEHINQKLKLKYRYTATDLKLDQY